MTRPIKLNHVVCVPRDRDGTLTQPFTWLAEVRRADNATAARLQGAFKSRNLLPRRKLSLTESPDSWIPDPIIDPATFPYCLQISLGVRKALLLLPVGSEPFVGLLGIPL